MAQPDARRHNWSMNRGMRIYLVVSFAVTIAVLAYLAYWTLR
jgi:hypothetical protein